MGVIILDASGLILRGGESTFCHHVLKTCSKNSFTDAYIGIADSAFTATVASRLSNRRITIIPQGQDAQFLAPLSIKHLKLAENIQGILITLGITTMGELASLPASSLNERFGKAGEIIWKPWELAQGIDDRKPVLPEPEEIYECFLDLGGAVSQFNEIVFALKSMLDKLTDDLKQSGLQAQELVLSLYHENDKFDERTLQLVRPSREVKFLLEIIRLSLAANSIRRELTGIKITISRFTQEQWKQVGLGINKTNTRKPITNNSHLTQAELLLLQRFVSRLGKNKIHTAKATDQYISENAGVWFPVENKTTDSTKKISLADKVLLTDMSYIKNKVNQPTISDLVLRPSIPSLPVLVQLKDAKPATINYKKRWYKVKSITQPEYLSCHWWNQATAKYYYKILVEDNQQSLLMLLVHDQLKNSWCVEGLYD